MLLRILLQIIKKTEKKETFLLDLKVSQKKTELNNCKRVFEYTLNNII